MSVSNCCLIEDGNLSLQQMVDESSVMDEIEDK